jgi:hypothetical protein
LRERPFFWRINCDGGFADFLLTSAVVKLDPSLHRPTCGARGGADGDPRVKKAIPVLAQHRRGHRRRRGHIGIHA